MNEHAALKFIFDAHKVVVEKAGVEEQKRKEHKDAKDALDEAQTILNERIQEARTGQEMLPFEGTNGQKADEARMDGPIEPVTPAEAAKRRRAKK